LWGGKRVARVGGGGGGGIDRLHRLYDV